MQGLIRTFFITAEADVLKSFKRIGDHVFGVHCDSLHSVHRQE
jgi:hypothetical protein